MNKPRWAWLLALPIPLLLLWSWRNHVQTRRDAEMALFLAYIDGPLNDYAFSVTRPKAESRDYAVRSSEGLKKLLEASARGWLRDELEILLPLHQSGQTREIIVVLEKVRIKALETWKLPKSRYLELNALIYSLKEVFNKKSE